MKLLGSHLFSNPDIYSLKTSRDSSTTTEEIPLRSSSQRWMNWGMMWNGKCLTAKILESPKIGNVCSLQGYQEAEIGDSVNLSHPNSKTRRGRVGKQIANTLLTGESQGVVEPDFRIRKLTPRECWRLQGFPDWAFDKAQEVNSNSQLYKQAGNSVTVNVIAAIAKELS
ncbi:DNA methylase [Streptococcus pneumoniae]|nr:DNA methylase [Streptococcus pneumoniae]